MQRGQRESVSRGQPRGGLVFSHDLSRGLSDHFGTKPGFWLIWLNLSKTNQAAPAAYVKAFSTYLIGLCISLTPPSYSASPVDYPGSRYPNAPQHKRSSEMCA